MKCSRHVKPNATLAGSIALIWLRLDSAHRRLRQHHHRLAFYRLASVLVRRRGEGAKLVAIRFFLLAPYVTAEAIHKLATGEHLSTSWLGIALTATSVIGMPFLGVNQTVLRIERASGEGWC